MKHTFLLLALLLAALATLRAADILGVPRTVIPAQSEGKAVPQAAMEKVYGEVKTPFKYGIVLRGEGGQNVDCPTILGRAGSLHLKGTAVAGVKVRLVDGNGQEMFATTMRDVGPSWAKRSFDFTAHRASENATFEVSLSGKGDVLVDMVSLFPKSALDNGGFRPDLLQAIKDLKPSTIRYPGGCFASAYSWITTSGHL